MTATLLRKVPKRVCPECGRFVRVTRGGRFAWHYRLNVSGPGSRCPRREVSATSPVSSQPNDNTV
jgi:hypothetical protein